MLLILLQTFYNNAVSCLVRRRGSRWIHPLFLGFGCNRYYYYFDLLRRNVFSKSIMRVQLLAAASTSHSTFNPQDAKIDCMCTRTCSLIHVHSALEVVGKKTTRQYSNSGRRQHSSQQLLLMRPVFVATTRGLCLKVFYISPS